MDTTILQVPISKALRSEATAAAKEYGFSSLQEIVRVLLSKLAKRDLVVHIEEPVVKLSKKNERRYMKMHDDIVSGKVKTKSFKNVDDMMAYLNK